MTDDDVAPDDWFHPLDSPPVDLDALQGVAPGTVVDEAAVTLARIRATGEAPVVKDAVLAHAAEVAGVVDRELIELSDAPGLRRLVLGWAAGAGPDPGRHPSARPKTIPPIAYVVWATCLAAVWPDPALDPWPGGGCEREDVLNACAILGADRRRVVNALDVVLPQAGLLSVTGSVVSLGRGAAALPATVWSALRRVHDRLPHEAVQHAVSDRSSASPEAVARRLPRQNVGVAEQRDVPVSATVTALEIAREPVADNDLPGLRNPVHRRQVEQALAGCGRVLVQTPRGQWTTGYADGVRTVLVEQGIGTLRRVERAVLALVLLHTVAIPRAQGKYEGNDWASSDHPVTFETLLINRKTLTVQFRSAIRGLRAAGYLESDPNGGYVPGPALARLSDSAREALWEDLVLLARPNGYLAERIRVRRADRGGER